MRMRSHLKLFEKFRWEHWQFWLLLRDIENLKMSTSGGFWEFNSWTQVENNRGKLEVIYWHSENYVPDIVPDILLTFKSYLSIVKAEIIVLSSGHYHGNSWGNHGWL